MARLLRVSFQLERAGLSSGIEGGEWSAADEERCEQVEEAEADAQERRGAGLQRPHPPEPVEGNEGTEEACSEACQAVEEEEEGRGQGRGGRTWGRRRRRRTRARAKTRERRKEDEGEVVEE